MQSQSDEFLMEQFKTGDEPSFSELYRRYNRRVYAYCLRMVNSRELAEDLYQDIFVRVARKRLSFAKGNFAAWLFAIARNVCLNAIRDRVEYVPIEDVQDHLQAAPQYDEGDYYEEQMALLRQAVEQLPHDMREVLVLRVYNGFSYEEIAEITETKLATVKVRIFRAKQRLHRMLAPHFHEE